MDYMGFYNNHRELQGEYSYDRAILEKYETQYFSGEIIKIKDLHFKNVSNLDPIIIDYPVFLAPSACQYYHAIVDVMATYESLKINNPSLQIIFCDIDNMVQYNKHKDRDIDYNNDILTFYNGSNILNLFEVNVIFKNVMLFPTLSMWNMDRIVPKKIQDSLKIYTHEELWEIRTGYVKHLVDRFKPHIKRKEKQKIYSARLPYDKIINGSTSLEELEKIIEADRWYPEELEIIDFFKSQGYKIVNLDGLGLIEQFSLFANSSHVAGIKGSNLFNAVFCDPGTEIIQINTQNWWHYEFETYFTKLNFNLIDLAIKECDNLPHEHGLRIQNNIIMDLLQNLFSDHSVAEK